MTNLAMLKWDISWEFILYWLDQKGLILVLLREPLLNGGLGELVDQEAWMRIRQRRYERSDDGEERSLDFDT